MPDACARLQAGWCDVNHPVRQSFSQLENVAQADLIIGLLHPDREFRLSASSALEVPYFTRLGADQTMSHVTVLPLAVPSVQLMADATTCSQASLCAATPSRSSQTLDAAIDSSGQIQHCSSIITDSQAQRCCAVCPTVAADVQPSGVVKDPECADLAKPAQVSATVVLMPAFPVATESSAADTKQAQQQTASASLQQSNAGPANLPECQVQLGPSTTSKTEASPLQVTQRHCHAQFHCFLPHFSTLRF